MTSHARQKRFFSRSPHFWGFLALSFTIAVLMSGKNCDAVDTGDSEPLYGVADQEVVCDETESLLTIAVHGIGLFVWGYVAHGILKEKEDDDIPLPEPADFAA